MAMLLYAATIAAVFLHLLYRRRCCRSPLLIDWPVLGMLPQFLYNASRFNDFIAHALNQRGGTAEFMGPWFTNMKLLFTSDPMNVHHILVKNFDNYAKGAEFREIFNAFGDGILSADSETWKNMRTLFKCLFKQKSFEVLVEKSIEKKVQNDLLPILDNARRRGIVMDLQDLFCRLTFDQTSCIGFGYDPNCLSIDLPIVEAEKAFDEIEENVLRRSFAPKYVWKLQEWLQIGAEKRMTKACKVFEQFVYARLVSKRQELSKCNQTEEDEAHHHPDLVSGVMREGKDDKDDKYLRDAVFNLFIAGKNTIASALTWFFWLVSTNPLVEAKILEEIKGAFGANEVKNKVLGMEEVKKLVYLHCALCESLRLFPPIPFERKKSIKSDTLPNGHRVHPNTNVLFCFYAMGRCEEIWGKDCLEFKPERWISEKGGIVHVPSHKFVSFNTGPRTCLGKDLSLVQLKMVATSVLSNYRVHVVEGHPIVPAPSVVLLMKHGLKVRIIERQD